MVSMLRLSVRKHFLVRGGEMPFGHQNRSFYQDRLETNTRGKSLQDKNGRSCLAGAAIKKTNDFYGGLSYTGERVIFVNGDIDPWHKLSLNQGETSPRNDKVRKRSFPTFPVFLTKQKLTMIIYQDRLGTNIEKTQK